MNHYNSLKHPVEKDRQNSKMNKLMEERERVCVYVCIYVCERETENKTETAKCQQSDQGKMKTYGTQVQFPFFFFFFFEMIPQALP